MLIVEMPFVNGLRMVVGMLIEVVARQMRFELRRVRYGIMTEAMFGNVVEMDLFHVRFEGMLGIGLATCSLERDLFQLNYDQAVVQWYFGRTVAEIAVELMVLRRLAA